MLVATGDAADWYGGWRTRSFLEAASDYSSATCCFALIDYSNRVQFCDI